MSANNEDTRRTAQAPVAQWLEQRTHNSLVLGSSPGGSTKPVADFLDRIGARPTGLPSDPMSVPGSDPALVHTSFGSIRIVVCDTMPNDVVVMIPARLNAWLHYQLGKRGYAWLEKLVVETADALRS